MRCIEKYEMHIENVSCILRMWGVRVLCKLLKFQYLKITWFIYLLDEC